MILGSVIIPESFKEMLCMVQERSIQVQLCYGEENQIVDILATSLDNKEFYYNEVELPCDARGNIIIDRLHVPSFRI
ncbi:hypothetical protein P3L10_019478 [Capsicum annuum]